MTLGAAVFDGQSLVSTPDRALTAQLGGEILDRLRRGAAEALAERNIQEGGKISAQEILDRPHEWGERIWNRIYAVQALSPVEVKEWLMEEARGQTPGATLDIETFQIELRKLNRELEKGGWPILDINHIYILKEREEDRQGFLKKSKQEHDLGDVGAYHDSEKIFIYDRLAARLTPKQLAAVALHERLAVMGWRHHEVVEIMQKLTRKAFGEAVSDVDLQSILKSVQIKPAPKPSRISTPSAQPVQGERNEDPITRAVIIFLTVALLPLLYLMGVYKVDGYKAMLEKIMPMAIIAAIVAPMMAASMAYSWWKDRPVPPSHAFEIIGLGEGRQNGWDISLIFFQNREGTLYTLELQSLDGLERIGMRWEHGGSSAGPSGYLFVLSPKEKSKFPNGQEAPGMTPREFRARYWGPLLKSAKNYPTGSEQDRAEVGKFLDRVERVLAAKEEGGAA